MTKIGIAALTVFAAMAAGAAEGATVIYTASGSGDYTLDGVDYSGEFTITAIGDTENIVPLGSPFPPGTYRLATSIAFDLAGVGDFSLSGSGYVIEVQGLPGVGFGSTTGGDFIDFSGPSLATYDLSTSFAPTGFGTVFLGSVLTTGGILKFDSTPGELFSADVTPEPASWALMLAGFACMGAALRTARRPSIPSHQLIPAKVSRPSGPV